jgi:5-methylcytosine-specific restriction endonuclease McrA
MSKKKKSYWTRLLKVCRQEWSRCNPERKESLKKAKVCDIHVLEKWRCNLCNVYFALSEVDVDHIVPVGNTIPQTKQEFIISFDRLHCAESELQILCKSCHKNKTKDECVKRKGDLLIKLVESYMYNNGFKVYEYSIDKLDRKSLRNVSGLFAKNVKTDNKKIVEKNKIKISTILKSCQKENLHGSN